MTRDGEPVDRKHVRGLFDPFMGPAVRDMRRLNLKSDQAAVAMIFNVMNTFQKNDVLKKLYGERYDLFISLVRLYNAAYLLMSERPEYFNRAAMLFDSQVFTSLDDIPNA